MAHLILLAAIQQQKEKEEKCDIWKDSPYKDLAKLESNNVGIIGETYMGHICNQSGISAEFDGSKTKKIGGGDGDGAAMGKTIEVKTARQGSGSPSFQHEMGEVPWKADVLAFVDISPDGVYLTLIPNFDEATYKSNKKLPRVFTTKSVTWRKKVGAFKLDTSVKINTDNIATGNCIKITPTTSFDEIGAFIRKQLSF